MVAPTKTARCLGGMHAAALAAGACQVLLKAEALLNQQSTLSLDCCPPHCYSLALKDSHTHFLVLTTAAA